MLQEFRFTTPPHVCGYLPTETACMSYRLRNELSSADYEALLARGWRRFGAQIFRPCCAQCAECRSLRVIVPEFRPTKSQRRVLKKNHDLQVWIQPASVSAAHVELYNQYHAFMTVEKGWKEQRLTEEEYAASFLAGDRAFAAELLYFSGDDLVGVGLVDVALTAASSVYFYHHPAMRGRALGVFSMLKELEYAASRGFRHHYLGYWVPACRSMVYKADYRPFELLVGYPADEEAPVWVSETEWRPVLNSGDQGPELSTLT
jgi:arginine-tRNA-protein transferase